MITRYGQHDSICTGNSDYLTVYIYTPCEGQLIIYMSEENGGRERQPCDVIIKLFYILVNMKFINTNYTTTVAVVDMVDERNINIESFLRICIYHVDIISLFHCCRIQKKRSDNFHLQNTSTFIMRDSISKKNVSLSLSAFSLFYFMSTLEPY